MVRFIIKKNLNAYIKCMKIYIPIWLDLLYAQVLKSQYRQTNLHSNMVRFIIRDWHDYELDQRLFTFQYG